MPEVKDKRSVPNLSTILFKAQKSDLDVTRLHPTLTFKKKSSNDLIVSARNYDKENDESDKGDMEAIYKRGKSREEDIDNLVGNEDRKGNDNNGKGERKDELEFDYNKVYPYHNKDKRMLKPED